jgi:hypothetical protein
MMGLFAVVLALASASPVLPPELDHSAYVEAHRPRLAPRALNGTERAQMRAAMAAARQPTAERLLALKPFAEAGDRDAIAAMVRGYQTLRGREAWRVDAVADVADPLPRYSALGALWAVRMQEAGRLSSGLTALFNDMVGQCKMPDSIEMQRTDCGMIRGYGTWQDRPMRTQAEIDGTRYRRIIAAMRGQSIGREAGDIFQINQADAHWMSSYAASRPALIADTTALRYRWELGRLRAGNLPMSPEMVRYAATLSSGQAQVTAAAVDGRRNEAAAQSRAAAMQRESDARNRGAYEALIRRQTTEREAAAMGYVGAGPAPSAGDLAARERAVNAANCVRADKGANIRCNR